VRHPIHHAMMTSPAHLPTWPIRCSCTLSPVHEQYGRLEVTYGLFKETVGIIVHGKPLDSNDIKPSIFPWSLIEDVSKMPYRVRLSLRVIIIF
jgi:hypothetical protein